MTNPANRRDFGKRSFAELRNGIQASLKKRAMTAHEISEDNGMHRVTVMRHLEWLETIGEVSSYVIRFQGQERKLWKLNK